MPWLWLFLPVIIKIIVVHTAFVSSYQVKIVVPKNRNIEWPWPKFNHSWRRSGCTSMPNFRPFVSMHSRKSLWSISLSQNCAKNSENHSPNDACNLQIWPVSFSYTLIKKINRPSPKFNYRKTSSISRAKSQNLNVSCILLQLSSFNPLKPGVKLKMKM